MRRIRPASLSTRLLLAMFGTIVLAQLVSSLVFFYDRKNSFEEFLAQIWAERVIDLVRELGPLPQPQRRAVLNALTPDKFLRQQAASFPSAARNDAFLELFRKRIAGKLNEPVTITPSLGEVIPDAEVTMLADLSAQGAARLYDVHVRWPDGAALILRLRVVQRLNLSYTFLLYLLVMFVALFIGAWVVSRGITVPLSRLIAAADALGRGIPQAPLVEGGPREVRLAARAFNSMQDRLHRYLNSRTRVLAAMSHDLRTPITRMLLRVEAVSDCSLQEKFTQDLQEMQSMVQGSLDMLQGLEATEKVQPIDVTALVAALASDFGDMGFPVSVTSDVRSPLPARLQALRRLLSNLLNNSMKFARRARIEVEELSSSVAIRVVDDGPGIPPDQLERVMEPYFRLESSRGRGTGGTGLGLSIARDIAQGHGGHLELHNSDDGGLVAVVSIPRSG